MPRWLVSLIIATALLVPSLARAQAPVTLSKLEVDLWPEYDRAEMLVIYQISLDPATPSTGKPDLPNP